MASSDDILQLLSGVGASSGTGPALINPSPSTPQGQAMLNAYAPLTTPASQPSGAAPTKWPIPSPATQPTPQAVATTSMGNGQTVGSGAAASGPSASIGGAQQTPFDPQAYVKGLMDQYDSQNKDDDKGTSADALRSQYQAGMKPAADQLSAALQQNPQYQSPHMSPLLMLGLTALGGLANRSEFRGPNPGAGTEMVQGPIDAMHQAALEKYQQAKESATQSIQNAQGQYGLAKDQNADLLAQAQQKDEADEGNAQGRRQFVGQTIAQAQGLDASQKADALKHQWDLESQDTQNRWAAKMHDLETARQNHNFLIQQEAARGNKTFLAQAGVEDFLNGKPHTPENLAAAEQIRQGILAKDPQDAKDELEQRINEETISKEKIETQQAQNALKWGDKIQQANINQINAKAAADRATAAHAGDNAGVAMANLAEQKRQFAITNPQDQERIDSGNYQKGMDAYNGARNTQAKEVEDALKALQSAKGDFKQYEGTSLKDLTDPNNPAYTPYTNLMNAQGELASERSKFNGITPEAFMYKPTPSASAPGGGGPRPSPKPTRPTAQQIAGFKSAAADAIAKGADKTAVNARLQQMLSGG